MAESTSVTAIRLVRSLLVITACTQLTVLADLRSHATRDVYRTAPSRTLRHAGRSATVAAGVHRPRKTIVHAGLGISVVVLSFHQVRPRRSSRTNHSLADVGRSTRFVVASMNVTMSLVYTLTPTLMGWWSFWTLVSYFHPMHEDQC